MGMVTADRNSISFPSDQILLLFAISPIAEDLFDLPFRFSFYEVGWRFQEVRAMSWCLIIGGQEGRMEYVMDFPIVGDFKSVGDVGYFGDYFERPVSSWCQFHCFVWKFQVGAFEPDLVAFFKWLVLCFFCHSVLGCL
jgi:hypothetical protein